MVKKSKKLTLKQDAFADAYVENKGNGTEAAFQTYDVGNRNEAKAIAYSNLNKAHIRDAINNKIKDFKDQVLNKVNELNSMNMAIETAHDDLMSDNPIVRKEARKFILEVAKFLSGDNKKEGSKSNHLHIPKWN